MSKIIFLDWNKTLSYSRFWQHWESGTNEYNSYSKPIIESLFNDNNEMIIDWMKAKYNSNQICDFLSRKVGLSSHIILKELEYSCKNMVLCDPQIPDLISKLRESGSKVYVATDNMDTFRKFTIPSMSLGQLFDDFLISYELKASKIDTIDVDKKSAFFHEFMYQNDFDYHDCILLDDCADKSDLYKLWGLETININSPVHLVDSLKSLLQ